MLEPMRDMCLPKTDKSLVRGCSCAFVCMLVDVRMILTSTNIYRTLWCSSMHCIALRDWYRNEGKLGWRAFAEHAVGQVQMPALMQGFFITEIMQISVPELHHTPRIAVHIAASLQSSTGGV